MFHVEHSVISSYPVSLPEALYSSLKRYELLLTDTSMLSLIRTLVFYLLFYGPFTIFWATFSGLVARILPRRWRYAMIILVWSKFALWSARWILGIRWQVEGRENLPENGGVVIVANHQSAWETFFLQALINPQSQVIKRQLLKIPFFGWTYAMANPIAIDREDRKSAVSDLIEQGRQRLGEGTNVLIFPEGTRRRVGDPGKFSRSAALLAKQAHVPMLPISHNAGCYWPPSLFSIKRPGRVKVVIHPMVSMEGQRTASVMENLEKTVHAGIAECAREP